MVVVLAVDVGAGVLVTRRVVSTAVALEFCSPRAAVVVVTTRVVVSNCTQVRSHCWEPSQRADVKFSSKPASHCDEHRAHCCALKLSLPPHVRLIYHPAGMGVVVVTAGVVDDDVVGAGVEDDDESGGVVELEVTGAEVDVQTHGVVDMLVVAAAVVLPLTVVMQEKERM